MSNQVTYSTLDLLTAPLKFLKEGDISYRALMLIMKTRLPFCIWTDQEGACIIYTAAYTRYKG